jgi:sensor histidine kinase regulating citrate/malate metabolism
MGRPHPRRWSLARQLFALLAVVLAVVVAVAVLAAYLQARRWSRETAREEVLSVALTVAASPTVAEGLAAPDPAAALRAYAEQVRRETRTDFVVVMSPEGTRYTHPVPERVGGQFVGHIEPARHGTPFTETYTGTLGPSMRAVVPVMADGRVVGLVSVGITLESVGEGLERQVPLLLGAGLVGLAVTGVVAGLLSRRLRRQTHGLGPAELAQMYEFHDAVLHAVREGLLLLGRDGRLSLVNDEGRRLLDLPDDAVGRHVGDLGLPVALADALAGGGTRTDEIHLTRDRVLVVNQAPARWGGRELGSVTTIRDRTDLLALSGELDSVRGLAESLRSQAHESANRLHTVISLIELGHTERALDVATAELAEAQELTDRVVGAVREPVVAALLLGKAAQASERGVELSLADDLDVPDHAIDARDLVTIVGNLVDNAIDAAASGEPPRRVSVAASVTSSDDAPAGGSGEGELVIRVADTGCGIDPDDVDRAFSRGWSTKPAGPLGGRGLGLALVGQAVRRNGGSVDVTRDGGAVFTVRLRLSSTGTPA